MMDESSRDTGSSSITDSRNSHGDRPPAGNHDLEGRYVQQDLGSNTPWVNLVLHKVPGSTTGPISVLHSKGRKLVSGTSRRLTR